MKKAADQQILDLFNKYRDQINNRFIEVIKSRGYESTDEVSEEGLWDELFCGMMIEDDHLNNIVDSIEDSVGLDSYGFVNTNDE